MLRVPGATWSATITRIYIVERNYQIVAVVGRDTTLTPVPNFTRSHAAIRELLEWSIGKVTDKIEYKQQSLAEIVQEIQNEKK